MKIGRHLEVHNAWLLWLPWILFGLGFVLNAIVMVSNNGLMPVLVPGIPCDAITISDGVHSCMTSTTHLKFLADWIMVSSRSIASPGDFLLWFSDYLLWPFFGAWFWGQCSKRVDIR